MGVSVDRTASIIDMRESYLPQKQQPAPWQPDDASDACTTCAGEFTWTRRRHHCRACGCLVCADCSPSLLALPHLGYETPVRVCNACTPMLSPANSDTSSTASDDDVATFSSDCLDAALNEIAAHARAKPDFVKSEAINWLVDSAVASTRTTATGMFRRLVQDSRIALTPGGAITYMISTSDVADATSHCAYLSTETTKCRNCARSYLARMAPAVGFCSLDCKTNSEFSRADALRAEMLCD
ncbi:Aste57867_10875 [Aphanomyces stellatus]|uniref:Aste57867_10875 protein n=1 Tax=Aphanomyces stellatus TaxID=120398 RepID=A0A485KRI8_9STRA|nr:hypothetical protein As57867_010835 [Aphanomyces stellatus]VFT87743.1 Aste57867_10875 [Aphanomyces stellatus]